MKNILIHGLGQNSQDWNNVKTELEIKGIFSITPDLFKLTKGRELGYVTVYQAFERLCRSLQDPLNPVSYTHLDVYKRQIPYLARTDVMPAKKEDRIAAISHIWSPLLLSLKSPAKKHTTSWYICPSPTVLLALAVPIPLLSMAVAGRLGFAVAIAR